MKLPHHGIDKECVGNTALDCFHALSENPAKWGWEPVHHDVNGKLPDYCLIFFKNCGKLPDGRTAGHIAVYSAAGNKHISNADYPMSAYWKSRIVGAFAPLP